MVATAKINKKFRGQAAIFYRGTIYKSSYNSFYNSFYKSSYKTYYKRYGLYKAMAYNPTVNKALMTSKALMTFEIGNCPLLSHQRIRWGGNKTAGQA